MPSIGIRRNPQPTCSLWTVSGRRSMRTTAWSSSSLLGTMAYDSGMFDLLEVLKSNPAFTQPYTLILLALRAGNADQRAFSSGYSGSVSGTPMSGVGPRYSEPGNNGSRGAGR